MIALGVSFLASLAPCRAQEKVEEIAADTLLMNARILTLDPRHPSSTALAITGERIVAIGSGAEIRPWRDRRSHVIDLRGATVGCSVGS